MCRASNCVLRKTGRDREKKNERKRAECMCIREVTLGGGGKQLCTSVERVNRARLIVVLEQAKDTTPGRPRAQQLPYNPRRAKDDPATVFRFRGRWRRSIFDTVKVYI